MPAFSRVQLPDDRKLNGRASQTMLRHANACMRSGYLYLLNRGESRTVEMVRGSALHAIAERAIQAAIEQGEPRIPGDIVKVLADEVLAEIPVPFEEHDYVREMAWRFGQEWTFDPSATVAVETLFVLDVGGFEVRCRIDFAELLEAGAAVRVVDFKSGRGAPPIEEVARKRPDGTLAAKSFQVVLYALALAYGVPVREEWCPVCDGNGMIGSVGAQEPGDIAECTNCTRGRIETPEPFPIAGRAQRFDLEYVFPGIEDREGNMLRRPVTLTRLELEEYRASLAGLVERVQAAEVSGDWPAVVSDAACGECPASSLCPIPAELRDHRGTVNTVEEFAEAMARLDREKAEHRARQTELRNFVKAHGGSLRFDGKVAELVFSESESVTDREGMLAAVERAVQYGEPFDRSRFVKVKGRTDFKTRDVTADDETEEAMAGD